ncbi:MAG TPA: 50S ribosomal protein L10 [Fibrobacteraceae bacterium]|nr:50S ribosomal protein L10 [Fibrobacteraceae bacterium]
MKATVAKKKNTVDALVKDFSGASSLYLVNFEKVTVDKDNALRKTLRQKGVKYRAVKNTLLKRVLEQIGFKGLDEYLVGATAVLVAPPDDPMMPAREIVAFQKNNPDLMSAKAIHFEGDLLPASDLEKVAKIPGRKDLLAQIVMAILSPGGRIVGAIEALEEKLEKAG